MTGGYAQSGPPVRVLVADDHPLFRRGLAALIRDCPDTMLLGEADSGERIVQLARQHAPDVVVMDVSMPGIGGVEATRRIANDQPSCAVLMLTMMDADDSVFAALRAGARGYVLKGAEPTEILRAITAVAAGQAIFGASIAGRVIQYFAAADRSALAPFPN